MGDPMFAEQLHVAVRNTSRTQAVALCMWKVFPSPVTIPAAS